MAKFVDGRIDDVPRLLLPDVAIVVLLYNGIASFIFVFILGHIIDIYSGCRLCHK